MDKSVLTLHRYFSSFRIAFFGVYTLYPWRTFFKLLNPIPWTFANLKPLTPAFIITTAGPDFFYDRHKDIMNLRVIPLFMCRDSPTCALYRLYDSVCAHDEIEMKHEATYIWFMDEWPLFTWPDPSDSDPLRYSILAGIMECLVEAFNWRLSMGLHRNREKERWQRATRERRLARTPQPPEVVPGWTTRVPPAQDLCILRPVSVTRMTDDMMLDYSHEPMKKRNIWAITGGMYFVW